MIVRPSVALDRGGRTWWVPAPDTLWLDDGRAWRRVDAPDAIAVIPAGEAIALVTDDAVIGIRAGDGDGDGGGGFAVGWEIAVDLGAALPPIAVDPARRVFVARGGTIAAIDPAGVAPIVDLDAHVLALSPDRRRLYAGDRVGLHRIVLDEARAELVVAWPAALPVPAAIALGPAGAIAIAGDHVIGINTREGRASAIRALPAELRGAAVAVDHRGTIVLATADGVWGCRGDGSDLGARHPR